jgi:hypothetical protein
LLLLPWLPAAKKKKLLHLLPHLPLLLLLPPQLTHLLLLLLLPQWTHLLPSNYYLRIKKATLGWLFFAASTVIT